MEILDIVRKTRILFQHNNWIQGKLNEGNNCFCLLGGFLYVSGIARIDGQSQLSIIFDKITGYRYISIWNDEPGRTKEDVMTLLDQMEKEILNYDKQ